MIRIIFFFCSFLFSIISYTQLNWQNVDSLYQPLPKSVKVFYTESKVDTAPFRAYYVIADLKNEKLNFSTDTTHKRRLTPDQFYNKNDKPLIVVNGTFFSFATNQNLNVVIKNYVVVAHNVKIIKSPEDTTRMIKIYTGAIGITKKRNADVAWIKTDSSLSYAQAVQYPYSSQGSFFTKNKTAISENKSTQKYDPFQKWNVQTAIGGGPVLIQNGEIRISNNEERMFAGKAINDKHPRTAMGYTNNNKLIILVVEGRNKNAGGATLTQLALILKQLGCVEALNLDGGGSSCLLINGKKTIKPSDAAGQRAVPAIFMIYQKK